MANERIKRDDPARTQPNRAVATQSGRGPGPGSGAPPDAGSTVGPPPRKHPNKVVEDAVGAAYRIADAHIQQGRRAAARVREGSYSSGEFEQDLKALLDRTLMLSKELGVATIDLFDGVVRAGLAPRTAAQGAAQGASGQSAPGPSPQEVTLQVKSTRHAQVAVHLSPNSSSFVPRVLPLHRHDGEDSPLKGVRFASTPGARPTLIVEVPNDQKSGAYVGSIVDEITGEPGGHVVVRILES